MGRHQIWYLANPKLHKKVLSDIKEHYRTLHVEQRAGTIFIVGVLPISDPNGLVIERFELEIELPDDYPRRLPTVRETGGKIPQTLDRHIVNGRACLFVPDERWKFWPTGSGILDFIEGPVRQFFLNQANFALTGEWLWGDRSHGAEGIAEYYFEELGVNDLSQVLSVLALLAAPSLNRWCSCFCRSGRILKTCHYSKVFDLRKKITQRCAAQSLQLLETIKTSSIDLDAVLKPIVDDLRTQPVKLSKTLPLGSYPEIWTKGII